MSNDTKWIIGLIASLFIIGVTILNCQKQENEHLHRMATAGYNQILVPGRLAPVWQRACPCSTMAQPFDESR